jgi:hypothetical protein
MRRLLRGGNTRAYENPLTISDEIQPEFVVILLPAAFGRKSAAFGGGNAIEVPAAEPSFFFVSIVANQPSRRMKDAFKLGKRWVNEYEAYRTGFAVCARPFRWAKKCNGRQHNPAADSGGAFNLYWPNRPRQNWTVLFVDASINSPTITPGVGCAAALQTLISAGFQGGKLAVTQPSFLVYTMVRASPNFVLN